jgi:Flp pilus assembly pilin Flp
VRGYEGIRKEVNMLLLLVRLHAWAFAQVPRIARGWFPGRGKRPAVARGPARHGENGQTTAEYALVILAAAAIAIVLIAWARSSGKLPAFFDKIIDDITNSAQ